MNLSCFCIRRVKLFLFIFFSFIFFGTELKSQTYFFDNYNVKEGLAQSKVFYTHQDSKGYLWLGTEAGVSRFDGINFVNYNTEDGLAQNGVKTILEDKQGNIWLGHKGGGISRISGNKIQSSKNDSINVDITCFLEDDKGVLWFGTFGNGAFRIENSNNTNINKLKLTHFKGGGNNFSDLVFFMMKANDGTIYFIVDKAIKIYNHQTNNFENYAPEGLPFFFQFTTMLEDHNGDFWFGTYHGGLYKSDQNGDYEIIMAKDGLADNWVTAISEDSQQNIWVGTWGGGVTRIKDKNLMTFNNKNGLEDLKIWDIKEDIEGNILIGSNDHGLLIYKGDYFTLFSENEGINGKQISSILHDTKNNSWFGTNKGITVIVENGIQYFNQTNGKFPSDQIEFIKEDKNGNIWIGTANSGIFQYLKSKNTFDYNFLINGYIQRDGIVTALEIDRNNNLWVGTLDGLVNYEINEDKVARISQEHGLTGNNIQTLFADSKNLLWIGSMMKGLTVYNNTDTSFTAIETDFIYTPTAITEASDGSIWVGTQAQGILVFKNQIQEAHYRMKDGLMADFITALNTDKKGNVYIGTSRGLNRFNIQSQTITKYTEKTGFTGIEVKNNSTAIDKNGNIWFGTVKGAFRLNNKAGRKKFTIPIVEINRLRVNLKDREIKKGLTLNYTENSIIFNYISIFITDPKAVTYKVMLEGADKDWRPETEHTMVNYSGLPAGDYAFKVKAKNSSGIWSSKSTSFSFTIKPPFWKSLWFLVIVTIIGTIGIFIFIKIRERNLIIEKKILEDKVEKRTTEIRAKNKELEVKNKNITDSIKYAKRIQDAMLPTKSYLDEIISDYFIFFRPRDIVSGDYYWASEKSGKLIVAAVDCTGHGVPGAFMSMLGITILDEIVNKKNITKASQILDEMKAAIIKHLKQKGRSGETQDGMDITLCSIDKKTLKMEMAGAYNPLYLIRDGELIRIKADRMPIGYYYKKHLPFTNNEIQLQKDDMLYLFSDGYIDQFSGETGNKLMTKNFKKYILEIYNKPLNEQKDILEERFDAWQANADQIDDIIVLGIRID
ncbi:MAG: hypothetical protein DRI95_00540 [Bacteroidetes bacterium]|nr:MAG: hypothetical protein DRI95_00540 [Bacteroidota bacterium]